MAFSDSDGRSTMKVQGLLLLSSVSMMMAVLFDACFDDEEKAKDLSPERSFQSVHRSRF